MRTSSFILAFFLIMGHLLSLTLASPLDSGRELQQNKRDTFPFYADKYRVSGNSTSSPVQTTATLSTPTPDAGQNSGSGSHLSSANAGVALASHGTVPSIALAGLIATVLAF
ncbi:hypothetical protein BJV77DRAFT_1002931 [Russula vinacea]|nr:hypothetical protein BJV77DRAFT_1002931 [Russula vinacea]